MLVAVPSTLHCYLCQFSLADPMSCMMYYNMMRMTIVQECSSLHRMQKMLYTKVQVLFMRKVFLLLDRVCPKVSKFKRKLPKKCM